MGQTHKLAAIMFSDIIGYSTIMSKDESQALNLLDKNRQIHKSHIEEFNGKFIKEIGDGILSIYQSSLDAVNCAVKIQETCKKIPYLQIRIGIHIGEVIIRNKDVFGDGVNIASRIEALGKSGEIYISERVKEDIENKSELKTEFVGIRKLKNISHPINIYSVCEQQNENAKPAKDISDSDMTSENTIAVLPFTNMSSDPEQEYFCDGIAEELINGLTKIRNLNVVARTSSFVFKNEKKDIREIGEKLNAGLLVEGSIRKAGEQLRITAQLIKVKDGFHLWSERYDKKIEDIFAIQDEITAKIVDRLKSTLQLKARKPEHERSNNIIAYDHYLKGRFYINKFLPENIDKAIEYYKKAIKEDPEFSLAYTVLAEAYTLLSTGFDMLPTKETMPKAREVAIKALDLNPLLPEAYVSLGLVALFYDWNPKLTLEYFNKAIELNPNSSVANQWIEFYWSFMVGDFDQSLAVLQRAEELDPLNFLIKIRKGYVYIYMRDFDRAIHYFQELLKNKADLPILNLCLLDAYGQKKKYTEALENGRKMWKSGVRAVASTGVLGYYYAITNHKENANEILTDLLDRSNKGYVSSFWIGVIYYGLGDLDNAFKWFERACINRDGNLIYITTTPQFDKLREDERYYELLKKMGLGKLSRYRFGDIIKW